MPRSVLLNNPTSATMIIFFHIFYRALVENESSVRELGNENLRQLVIELTQQLRKSATVDWQKRESVRARMRNLERRLLRKWKYPSDAAEEAIKLVLEQAEVLADGWYAA